MGVKFHRRISPKVLVFCAIGITILLGLYYTNIGLPGNGNGSSSSSTSDAFHLHSNGESIVRPIGGNGIDDDDKADGNIPQKLIVQRGGIAQCPHLNFTDADVNTVETFKDFDFQPGWMKMKEYWDKPFEDRYENQKANTQRPPLKVIIVPHSHNDPGWLKTFENYFHYQSRPIMSNMVTKLQQHKNLTFIWSEVAFLNAWWEVAHPSKQRALRSLAQSGRLEITTGGWVMTDEANAHMYAIIDQLIEGHQWLVANLGVKPKHGWSIDPFGHGSTVPYLLASAGIEGTIIQRIHYAWKQWLAWKQYGDFKWLPNWTPSDDEGHLLTHNQPFDIYSIKHSCGPHPYVCLNFDFRKRPGEFTEYSVKAQNITEHNVKEKAELLLEQYARTGSLFTHNVVLMPLGDDFRYNFVEEWDQQYYNYMKLIRYIQEHKDVYGTDVAFGTPADYFDAIVERTKEFPSLRGDFFVYSDIFSEGRPAYWSGYFTTRPFMKILDRELENSLRASEILYTLAMNSARQRKLLLYLKVLERDYEKLVMARRHLGLFQHHDAITGTSKSFVMRDYGLKLFESLRDTVKIQQNALQALVFGADGNTPLKSERNILLSDLERDAYEKLPKKTMIVIEPGKNRRIIVFNSLAQEGHQLVQVRVNTFNVKVYDAEGKEVMHQVNPVWNSSEGNARMQIADGEFELAFVARLPGLALVTFNLVHAKGGKAKLSTVYCNKCHRRQHDGQMAHDFLPTKFQLKNTQNGDVQLENAKLRLLFNGHSGFMKSVMRKSTKKTVQCGIQFAAYRSAQFHSGAYLFMPDPSENEIEKDVLQQYKEQMSIIITSGSVASDISLIYGPFLVHTVRIFHVDALGDAIYIENDVDFEAPPKNRETELFMRLITEVQNGEPPAFYTDSNGFSMQRRVKVERIGVEGNYFPITTQTFIQDDNLRITLLTNHAQGAAAWQPGFLEVMLDRRTLYDDSRGMGEGVVDNRKTTHKFWLLLEDVAVATTTDNDYETMRNFNNEPDAPPAAEGKAADHQQSAAHSFVRPSLFANHLSNGLNYPFGVFILEETVELNDTLMLLADESLLPCDVHVVTLRTQPDPVYTQFPANSALFILHRQGYACNVNANYTCPAYSVRKGAAFSTAQVASIQRTTLTGLSSVGRGDKDFTGINDISAMGIRTYNITFT